MSWLDGNMYNCSSSKEMNEWNEEKYVFILMLIGIEKNTRPKHGGSIVGREAIHMIMQEGNKLNYISPSPVYPN
jgi:hypothetical protein